MESYVLENWNQWNTHKLEDTSLVNDMKMIAQDESEIYSRFCKELEFGTGGLRGILGAGTNRMNIHTVAKASQGFSNYLIRYYQSPSVAIAYDTRINSDKFARTAACVFAANGIHVHMFEEPMPTPSLSFSIRHLKCSGGIVVTASHNPAPYNGYKVYGEDGCQITDKAASEIYSEILRTDMFNDIRKLTFVDAISSKKITFIGHDTLTAYIDSVSAQTFGCNEDSKKLSIIYTPLNGTGRYCVTRALYENGFTNVQLVREQEFPNGYFSTCPCPNPELPEALSLGLEYARQAHSDLLLATDPDCDRVAVAIKSSENFIFLSGNEVGLLLFDYICKRRVSLGTMPKNPIAVKTIVTTDLARHIAAQYGVELIDVLTGFKFIGEQIGILEASGEVSRYIFGFEESCGYLSGGYVRDKDGVNASLLICEMFSFYKAMGKNLAEVLSELYLQHGFCLNTLKTYEFSGADSFEKTNKVMECFRNFTQPSFAGIKLISVHDYHKSISSDNTGKKILILLPKSNVLKFELEHGISFTVRPSGTEPKLKLYFSVESSNEEYAKQLEQKLVQELENRFIHPFTQEYFN